MSSNYLTADNGVSSGVTGITQSAGNDGTLQIRTTTSGGTATTAVTVDNAQNVGVGVTPSAWLSTARALDIGSRGSLVDWSTSQQTDIWSNGYYNGTNSIYKTTANASIYRQSVGQHIWYNAPSGTAGNAITFTQAMTLDNSGNLGVGTTSPAAKLNISGGDAYFYNTATLGGIRIGYDGSNYWSIQRENVSTGRLGFFNGTSEKVSIDASGNLLVGTTSTYGPGRINVNFNGVSSGGVAILNANTGNAGGYVTFFNSGTTQIASISQNGASAVAYNTTSDYRLKENIAPMVGALNKVSQLKPCTYNWKVNGQNWNGFIAHELAEVCPEAVTGKKDDVDTEGKPVYQGIDTSFLVATLTAAIQELNAKVETQATTIATLQNKIGA